MAVCTAGLQIYLYIKNVFHLIIFLISIIAIYRHIKYYKKEEPLKKLPGSLHCTIITFYIFIMIFGLSEAFINECMPGISSLYVFFFLLSSISWLFQMLIMILILFMRLYYAFRTSMFRLSKRSIYIFLIIYILYVFSVFGAFSNISKLAGVIFIIIFIILSVYLSSLFVNKLNRINIMSMKAKARSDISIGSNSDSDSSQRQRETDDAFLSIITKSTILSIMSILTSLITMAFFTISFITNYTQNQSMKYVWDIVAAFDIITNFLGIFLSTAYSKKLYLFCCMKCDQFWKLKCLEYHQKHVQDMNELSDYAETNKSNSTISTPESV